MRWSRRSPSGGRRRRPALAALAVCLLVGGAGLGAPGAGAVTTTGTHARRVVRLATAHSTPGTPTLSATPATAIAPAIVTLSGTGFDPLGGVVSCHFTSGAPATTAALTLGATGTVSGNITLSADDAVGLNPIVCNQTSHTGSVLTAKFTFTVTTVSATCSIRTSPPTCTVGQVVGTTVTGTDLTLSEVVNSTPNATGGVNPTSENVALSKVTLGDESTDPACRTPHATEMCDAGAVVSDGHLNTVVVDDDRGDLAGWTVTGQMASNFEGPPVGTRHTIPATYLTWFPSVSAASIGCVTLGSASTCGPSDVLSEIAAGPAHSLSTSTSAILCQAAPDGGGGGTKCTADLVLAIPSYIVAGQYEATIDIVVS